MREHNERCVHEHALAFTQALAKLRVTRNVVGIGIARNFENDFEITTNEELMETFGSFTGSIKIFAFSVSVIALIVAGIGIMNIMLVSVTERIKEIGIRKAIGATKGHILIQFLTEAVFLCQVGGIIGVVFGIAAGNLISFVAKVPAVIPIDWAIYGVVSCSLIGIGFGSYPAWRAANLDPVESMRFE